MYPLQGISVLQIRPKNSGKLVGFFDVDIPRSRYAPPQQWTKEQRHVLGGRNGNSLMVEFGNTIDGWDGCDSCGNTSSAISVDFLLILMVVQLSLY